MAKLAPDPPGLGARRAAAARLAPVLRGAPFAPLVAGDLPDPRDRALANRLATTALRRHGHLDVVISRYLDRGMPGGPGLFEATLRIALGELLYLPDAADHSAIFLAVEAMKRDPRTRHISRLMNAVLRRAQADAVELRALPLPLLFPAGQREAWTATYGAAAVERFAEAMIEGAPLDITFADDDPALGAALGATRVLGDTHRVVDRDRRVDDLPGYAEGRWWVQDAAAALPARLIVAPAGAAVLDLCAAPGGKTAQLVKAGYAVTALDHDADRLARLSSNLGRLRMQAQLVTADAAAWRPDQTYQAVLLDAPCSATGTFRRHPEVVHHRRTSDIPARADLQRRLIGNAVACLEPGGTLIYCVCSLEPAEGEDQATWTLSAFPELELDPVAASDLPGLAAAVQPAGTVRTHPALTAPGPAGGTLDGFFIARFRRRP